MRDDTRQYVRVLRGGRKEFHNWGLALVLGVGVGVGAVVDIDVVLLS